MRTTDGHAYISGATRPPDEGRSPRSGTVKQSAASRALPRPCAHCESPFALMSWLGRRSGSVAMTASRAAVFGILLVLVTGAMSLRVVKHSTLMPSERKVPATNHPGSCKKCGVNDVYEAT